jgi:hypothetical protein
MDRAVKAWLLEKARDDLGDALEALAEAKELVKEYENRVVDPSWNECSFADDPPRDPKCPGKYTWGPMVAEWKKEQAATTKLVALLKKVVEALS